MPLTGDFSKLARWESALGKIADGSVAFHIADEMADVTLGLVAETFGRETDPYGEHWAAKKKADGRSILRGESNRLVQWRRRFVNQHGFAVKSQASYAKFHQRGTFNRDGSERMVARKMVPDGRLPPKWYRELRGVFVRRMHSLLTR